MSRRRVTRRCEHRALGGWRCGHWIAHESGRCHAHREAITVTAIAAARAEVVRAARGWYSARVAKRGPYMAEADALEAAVAALAKLAKP